MSRFKIEELNLCTGWRYNLPFNTECPICKVSLNKDSLTYESKGLSSYIMIGECNHAYHKECIESWTKNNESCPICSKKWIYKEN